MKKPWLFGGLLAIPALAAVVYKNYPKLNIITGFAAKNVCSCVFEAERQLHTIEAGDNDFQPVRLTKNKVDRLNRKVTATVLGLKPRTAVYKEGFGCTLLPEDAGRNDWVDNIPNRRFSGSTLPYPYGSGKPVQEKFANVDYSRLQLALEAAFDREGEKSLRSRAVVVLHKDHLIAEKYAPEFNENTKLLGWSMSKSITNSVVGALHRQGKIDLSQTKLFKEWEKDERAKITLANLLEMNSGLEWNEDYTTISDVTRMLFLEDDMPGVQLKKPLKGTPGNSWNYSSGTSNLLSGLVRDQFDSHQEYLDFWYAEVIDKIGMDSMTLETDLSGNYVGSSYSWATARDWAKFGLLYLNKGNWNGEQVLEESWVNYTATPTAGSNGEYGAHFWLNAGGKYPDVPTTMFSCNGFQGQYIFIIPSHDLVVARFGLTEDPEFDINKFLSGILAAIEQ